MDTGLHNPYVVEPTGATEPSNSRPAFACLFAATLILGNFAIVDMVLFLGVSNQYQLGAGQSVVLQNGGIHAPFAPADLWRSGNGIGVRPLPLTITFLAIMAVTICGTYALPQRAMPSVSQFAKIICVSGSCIVIWCLVCIWAAKLCIPVAISLLCALVLVSRRLRRHHLNTSLRILITLHVTLSVWFWDTLRLILTNSAHHPMYSAVLACTLSLLGTVLFIASKPSRGPAEAGEQ